MRLAKWMYWNTSRCEWNYSFPSWPKLTARLQVNMSWLALLLYLFLSLPQTTAVRWDGVQPTQVHLRGLQGHEPTTTPRPTVRPALFKRGGIVSGTANLDDGVCGTDIIASEASFVLWQDCTLGGWCGFNTHARNKACCASIVTAGSSTYLDDCDVRPTACVPVVNISRCDSVCMSDPLTTKCDTEFSLCNTATFVDLSITEYQCWSTSQDIKVTARSDRLYYNFTTPSPTAQYPYISYSTTTSSRLTPLFISTIGLTNPTASSSSSTSTSRSHGHVIGSEGIVLTIVTGLLSFLRTLGY